MKYTCDGVLEVKEPGQLEYENGIPPPGKEAVDQFEVGDVVMAEWRDKIFYEAIILNVDGKCYVSVITAIKLLI